jgi:hypothetical protein
MHITNKAKSVKFKWLKYPLAGILYCSCGKDNPFKAGKDIVPCTNCYKKHYLVDYVPNYYKIISEAIGIN